jgi:hypothetical protein
VIGENSVLGDVRWAGAFGIQADFIAKTPCSIMCVDKRDVLVRTPNWARLGEGWPTNRNLIGFQRVVILDLI